MKTASDNENWQVLARDIGCGAIKAHGSKPLAKGKSSGRSLFYVVGKLNAESFEGRKLLVTFRKPLIFECRTSDREALGSNARHGYLWVRNDYLDYSEVYKIWNGGEPFDGRAAKVIVPTIYESVRHHVAKLHDYYSAVLIFGPGAPDSLVRKARQFVENVQITPAKPDAE